MGSCGKARVTHTCRFCRYQLSNKDEVKQVSLCRACSLAHHVSLQIRRVAISARMAHCMAPIICHPPSSAKVPRVHFGSVTRCQRGLQVFLDALGEPLDSVRRLGSRGIYDWQVLNHGTQYEVDLFLLDERYERVPLPCHTAARMCTSSNVTLSDSRKARPPFVQLPVQRMRLFGDGCTTSLWETQRRAATGVV